MFTTFHNKFSKSAFSTLFAVVVTFLLLLSFAVKPVSAAGPVGSPPTQNPSPHVSDIYVEGELKTTRSGVHAGFDSSSIGKTINTIAGAIGLNKIKNDLSSTSPAIINDGLIVSNYIMTEAATFWGGVNVYGSIQNPGTATSILGVSISLPVTVNDDLLVMDSIDAHGGIANNDGSNKLSLIDDDGTLIHNELDVAGVNKGYDHGQIFVKDSIDDDASLGGDVLEIGSHSIKNKNFDLVLQDDANKSVVIGDPTKTNLNVKANNAKSRVEFDAGIKDFLFNTKNGAFTVGDPMSGKMPSKISLWGKSIDILGTSSGKMNIVTNGSPMNISTGGGKLDITGSPITVNGNTTFVGTTKFMNKIGSDVSVDGHLKAISIGKVDNRTTSVSIPPLETKKLTGSCGSGEILLGGTEYYDGKSYVAPISIFYGTPYFDISRKNYNSSATKTSTLIYRCWNLNK